MSRILYFQNRVEDLEGLCNQLMAVFRALTEALHCADRNMPSCLLLADGQTRNSIDFDRQPYFSPLPIDAFVEVEALERLLAAKNISVRRLRDAEAERDPVVLCSRFPLRSMTPDECRIAGTWIAQSFPFSRKTLNLARLIIGCMSIYPQWTAVHLRMEKDLMQLQDVRDIGLGTFTKQQLQQATGHMSGISGLSAVYIASGAREESYRQAVKELTDRCPHIAVKNKADILRPLPELWRELEALSLEEQALVDWLVCLGAPHFLGPHTSSFAYLAGYMRHYRGFERETTQLWPTYQPAWESWFPRV